MPKSNQVYASCVTWSASDHARPDSRAAPVDPVMTESQYGRMRISWCGLASHCWIRRENRACGATGGESSGTTVHGDQFELRKPFAICLTNWSAWIMAWS